MNKFRFCLSILVIIVGIQFSAFHCHKDDDVRNKWDNYFQ